MFFELGVLNTSKVVQQNREMFSVKNLNYHFFRMCGRNCNLDVNFLLSGKALRKLLWSKCVSGVPSNLNTSDSMTSTFKFVLNVKWKWVPMILAFGKKPAWC